jgi:ribose transport system substrate-binding protein
MHEQSTSRLVTRGRFGAGLVVASTALLVLAACSSADTPSTPDTPSALGTCATSSEGSTASDVEGVADAQDIVDHASLPSTEWDGPTDGPKASSGVSVVYIASNASNTGDTAVYDGLKEAAGELGWDVKFIDGQGSTSNNINALSQAIALKPDAIAVSSFDAASAEPLFEQALAAGIPVIGNHTGQDAGVQAAYPHLFTNITSDPTQIAQAAAACAIVASNGTAGVTITGCGTEFPICQAKQDAMEATMETCPGCDVLGKNSYPFENINQQEPGLATADYQRFGDKLTYMLSINDNYWDAAIPALQAAGVSESGPPLMIAAGDGSPAAFKRIADGQYQIASVAEPLSEHGWQMADEINRAINGEPESGFVTFPHLVTAENVHLEGGDSGTFDPGNNYRDEYKKIWGIG